MARAKITDPNFMSPKLEVDFLIPGVFERIENWSLNYTPFPEFKGLEQLLNLSAVQAFGYQGYENTLWKLLQTSYVEGDELPVARQLSASEAGMVCRADPVHLRADIADLILVDTAQLDLAAQDCIALEQIIHHHLTEIGGQYTLTEAGQGVMTFPEVSSLSTTPISQVAGRGIQTLMPMGEHQGRWHRLMNEFQMLLHDTELNQRRADRGKVPINALWIWGAGQCSEAVAADYDLLVGGDTFSQGLAQSINLPVVGLDDDWAGRGDEARCRILVVSTALLPAAQYDDLSGWLEAMQKLEDSVAELLLDGVQGREISQLRLFPCDGRYFQIKPLQRWQRLFRKRRTLVQQAARIA
ncbi:MAG TPA: hypothetical protein ENJ84_09690 [Gammaproteobacteria bacterium]|nr:hypothetical protein [Gammaproteobacteria bacterium]